MSAIITENFRRNNTRLFLNDISAQTNGKYYLGIGKQDRWDNDEENITFTPPVAVGTQADASEVLNNLSTLVSLNALTGVGRVIPAVAWKSGNTYQAYSSYNSAPFYPSGTLQPCYVTINGAIFLCLKTGLNASGVVKPSTVAPSVQSSEYAPFTLSDAGTGSGYIWVLVQEAPNTQIIRNNTFTDIRTTKLTGTEETNSITQCGGLVTGFTIVSGGTGYTTTGSTPSVLKLRVNDGFTSTDRSATSVTLNFTVSGGAIDSVSFPAGWPAYSGSNAAIGALFASIEFTGSGSGAKIVPTIAPAKGFAYDPSAVMPSWFAGLAISLDDSISGDNFYSRYRQISIVKNPTVEAGQESAGTLNALKYINFPDTTDVAGLVVDANSSVLKNNAGEVIGYADKLITTTGAKKLYFHQNLSSGYRELPPSGSIEVGSGSTEYAYESINNGEFINDGNAEVLFTENRSFISRASGQTEDLILIIQF
jgi:hypothetical protein